MFARLTPLRFKLGLPIPMFDYTLYYSPYDLTDIHAQAIDFQTSWNGVLKFFPEPLSVNL